MGDDRALAKVLKYHPAAVAGLGDLYAADHDWARAIAAYRKGVTADSSDRALLAKLADAYRNDGRTARGSHIWRWPPRRIPVTPCSP